MTGALGVLRALAIVLAAASSSGCAASFRAAHDALSPVGAAHRAVDARRTSS